MKIKEGASLNGLQRQMRPALMHAERIWKKYDQELVVTSGTDGEHSAGSLHYYGYALDFRTHYFKDNLERSSVAAELRAALQGLGFRVILHTSHIHVDYVKILDVY